MNRSNFFSWFLNQFVTIGTFMINKLDQIYLVGNVSLLDFIITIAIIGIFVSIVITAPQLGVVNRALNQRDREIRREKYKNAKKGKKG